MLNCLFASVVFANRHFILINSFQIMIKFNLINFHLNNYEDNHFENILIFNKYLFNENKL